MSNKPSIAPFISCKADETFSPDQQGGQKFPDETPLPFYKLPMPQMELFNPDIHLAHISYRPNGGHSGPSGASPPLPLFVAARAHSGTTLIPRPEDCYALWDKYEMLDNIRAHSERVAGLALALANRAREKGLAVSAEATYAAGLLHDLAKTYTIVHSGNHAQLGAAWTMHETRNAPIAHCVLYHVHWPWEEHFYDTDFFMVMAIEYADKRVRHDSYVSLGERFEDLLVRYGKNAYARERIAMSHEQGKRVENTLSQILGVDLHEYIADRGRLVQRA